MLSDTTATACHDRACQLAEEHWQIGRWQGPPKFRRGARTIFVTDAYRSYLLCLQVATCAQGLAWFVRMSAKRSFDAFRGIEEETEEESPGVSEDSESELLERGRTGIQRSAKLRRASQRDQIAEGDSFDSEVSEEGVDRRFPQANGRKAKSKHPEVSNDLESSRASNATIINDDKDLDPGKRSTDEPSTHVRRRLKEFSEPSLGDFANGMQKTSRMEKKHKPGIIYLSRIPPYLTPSHLRTLLAPYGELNRIFLTPEPDKHLALRRRNGGNKKRNFVDGWVEFIHKRDAKAAAELLNSQTIGGKKGGWYRDDIWSMRYLRGFKWDDLMEQRAAETKEREGRMRAEVAQVTRENKRFQQNVKHARMVEAMQEKRRRQLEAKSSAGIDEGKGKSWLNTQLGRTVDAPEERNGATTKSKDSKTSGSQRYFRQTEVHRGRDEPKLTKTEAVQENDSADQVQRVLSKIF